MDAYLCSLNNVNNRKFNLTKKLSDLTVNQRYLVVSFKNVPTKYGESLIATINDNNSVFDVFLPKRYSEVIFNNDYYEHYLIYKGKEMMKNGTEFHNIYFDVKARSVIFYG